MDVDIIYNEDCLIGMEKIPDKSINCVICDLPYGITQNKWDIPIPLEELWKHYDRVCKDNAVIALFGSQPFSSMLVMSNLKMFRHEWIWLKNRGSNFANTVREPFKEHEHILIFSKGKWTYNKQMQPRTGGGLERVKYDFNRIPNSDTIGNLTKLIRSKESFVYRHPIKSLTLRSDYIQHRNQFHLLNTLSRHIPMKEKLYWIIA